MNTRIIYCTCGLWHDAGELEKFKKFEDGIPELVNCDECPICNSDDELDDNENMEDLEEE